MSGAMSHGRTTENYRWPLRLLHGEPWFAAPRLFQATGRVDRSKHDDLAIFRRWGGRLSRLRPSRFNQYPVPTSWLNPA